jgi:hypothetical protein
VHTPLTSFILNAVNGKYYLETRSHLQLKGEFVMLSDWLAPAANSLISVAITTTPSQRFISYF